MTFEILIFGAAATAAGAERVRVSVGARHPPEDATWGVAARDLLTSLGEEHPRLKFALSGARLAVEGAFAAPERLVLPTDEVALISLLGGG